MVAEAGGSIKIGHHCTVLENPLGRATGRHNGRIGDHCLIGPNSHVVEAAIESEVFIVARVQAVIRLAEARQEADQALHAESLRVMRLLEQAPSFICVLRGPDHVYDFANAAYRRIVGQRDVIGRSVHEALSEVVEQGFIELLDQVVAGDRVIGEAQPCACTPGRTASRQIASST